jgi:hypothetical protein
MKRVFIIHGWGGRPDCGWFVWLKKELSSRGFKVHLLNMPNKETPKIKAWTNYLKKIVGKTDENTYFVGHSIGCQTIIRYLEKLPKNAKIGGVVFVAGFFTLTGLEDEEKPTAKPWLETPINTKKVKQHTKKFIALFSSNDPYVPLSNKNLFKKRLNAKIIIEKNKGHYIERVTKKIPVVLKELLKMSK